jgi:uncharacterized iron-regulated membrane protein
MKPATRRVLHASHAWSGAVFGLALFIVCLSGVWAVADAHLRYWEAGARRLPIAESVDIDRMLAAARAQMPPNARQISIALPTALHPVVTVSSGPAGRGGPPRRISLDPATVKPVPDATGSAGMAPIVTTLHKSLYAGFPGRIVVSLMGVALTVLLVGGIVLHPRRRRDWTALRWAKGWRAATFDLHKLLGLWLLPVLLLIAVTGIFSGLGALGTMALSRLAYAGGMPEALAELTGGPPARVSGIPATLPPLQALIDAHRLRDPGLSIESVTLANVGDAEAVLTLAGTRAGLLSTSVFERTHYRARDGLLLREDSVRGRGGWLRAFAAVQPLHYAQYGGGWGLALHLLGGLGAAALAATGTLLWLGRRAAQGGPLLAGRLVAGLGGGFAVACAVLLVVAASGQGAAALGMVFWGGWGLATAGLVLAPRRDRTAAWASALAGGLLLCAAGIDLVRSLAQPLAVAAPALRVDAFLLSAGAGLLALGLRLHFRSKDSP